jgi:hypothetical protein
MFAFRIALAAGCLIAVSTAGGRLFAQEPADPARPAAIHTQEVPLVPPAIAARLQQYQNMRAAGFAGWEPTGNGILIRTRFGNSLQLHRVYEPGGRREQITFFQEPVDGGFLPKSSDEAMLLSMSSGGSENNQVYAFNRSTFKTELLTDGKSRNGIGAVRHDGGQMVLSSNERNGRDTDLYLADPRTPGKRELLMQVEKEFWSAVDWSADGKTLLLLKYVSINESYLALFDIASRQRTDLPLPRNEKGAFGAAALAKDGKSIFVSSDAGGEFRKLLRYDIASKTYEPLADDLDWDVNDIEVDPTTGNVVFSLNADGASRVFLLAEGSKGKLSRRELKLPLGIASSLEFSPDGRQLGFTLARADAPADAYSLELSTDRLTRWTYSEVGGLNPESFTKPTAIRYPSFDGKQIPAWYYKPQSRRSQRQGAGADCHPRRPGRAVSAVFLRLHPVFCERVGHGGAVTQRARQQRLWQDLSQAGQRRETRRQREGYRRPAGLDQNAARSGRRARGGERRILRRVYGARFAGPFWRPDQGGHRHCRHRQLHHFFGDDGVVSARFAPRGVWRRARSRHAESVRTDQPGESCRKNSLGAARSTRQERSSRAVR